MSMNELFGGAGAPKRWVSGTTYAADAVVLSPVDFSYYVRKIAGAGTTDPSSDTTNWQNTNGFKSVQRGIASTPASSVTISAVNIAKCSTYCVGSNSNSGGTITTAVGGTLTNSTTLTLVNGNQSGGGQIAWEITERF